MDGYDIIAGKVSDIVDEATFYIEPRRDGADRGRERSARMLIHIHRIKLDDVVWITGRFSRRWLETILWRRNVTCRVKSLERGGAIYADVYLS